MRIAALALIATLSMPLAASADDLMRDPIVRSFCRLLVQKATTERFHEQGAFVVRTAGGTLYFVMWPRGDEKDVLRWYGRFPDGTIAIVHTHPPWLPAPSPPDIKAARGAGIPIYVITATSIARTTGEQPEVIAQGDW
jgi:proteasome lid subunit RPN8/RPN11